MAENNTITKHMDMNKKKIVYRLKISESDSDKWSETSWYKNA
jgi:nucleoid-associated protein YejK